MESILVLCLAVAVLTVSWVMQGKWKRFKKAAAVLRSM
jgi:hypothetical protein